MSAYMLTSVLEFADRLEGQVYHVGTKEDCERVQSLIPAISYNGDDVVLAAWTTVDQIKPERTDDVHAGTLWRVPKETHP